MDKTPTKNSKGIIGGSLRVFVALIIVKLNKPNAVIALDRRSKSSINS